MGAIEAYLTALLKKAEVMRLLRVYQFLAAIESADGPSRQGSEEEIGFRGSRLGIGSIESDEDDYSEAFGFR